MFPFKGKTSTLDNIPEIQAQFITREWDWECHRFCWSLGTRTGRDFSGFLRGLFGRKLEWQKHWHRHYTTVRATQCTQGGGLEAFIAYHCEGSTNAQHHCELGGTQGCWRHLLLTSIPTQRVPHPGFAANFALCTLLCICICVCVCICACDCVCICFYLYLNLYLASIPTQRVPH